MSETIVWGCEDLRMLIFSYLRKDAKLRCKDCSCVLIWDKEVELHVKIPWLYNKYDGDFCMSCWGKYIPMSRHPCIIS